MKPNSLNKRIALNLRIIQKIRDDSQAHVQDGREALEKLLLELRERPMTEGDKAQIELYRGHTAEWEQIFIIFNKKLKSINKPYKKGGEP